MDNKICVFDVLNRFKFMRKKAFKGHMVSLLLNFNLVWIDAIEH